LQNNGVIKEGVYLSLIYLDEYTNRILTEIYANQDLCKYLYYDDVDPLSYPEISDTKVLFNDNTNKRIYSTHFNIDIINAERTTLTVNVAQADSNRGNIYYKNVKMKFYILCPMYLWQLSAESGESKLRPNAIVHELLTMFDRQRTFKLGKDLFSRMYEILPSQQIGGYCLEINGMDFVVNY
jgi:hypothetical protein